MSALVKQRQSKQSTPDKNELQDLNNLSRQLSIFQNNHGLSICDQCGKTVEFKDLERMNPYSDFLVCGNCNERET